MKWRALLSALGSAAFALGAFAFAFFCAVDVQFGDLRFAVGNTTMRHWALVPMVGTNACAMPLLGGGYPCTTASSAPPIPAHVQSAESSAITTPGASAMFTNPVGNGHLVAGVASYSNTCTLGTITDDSAVQATQVDTGTDTTEGQKSTSFYFANVTDSLRTVTENVTGAGCSSSVVIDEYSGVATVSPLDGTAHAANFQNSPGTGANAITSGSVTTVTSGDLIYGANNIVGGLTGITAGTGYTLRQTQTGLQDNLSSEDKVQAVAGAVAATFTTNSNQDTITNVMAFKP